MMSQFKRETCLPYPSRACQSDQRRFRETCLDLPDLRFTPHQFRDGKGYRGGGCIAMSMEAPDYGDGGADTDPGVRPKLLIERGGFRGRVGTEFTANIEAQVAVD